MKSLTLWQKSKNPNKLIAVGMNKILGNCRLLVIRFRRTKE